MFTATFIALLLVLISTLALFILFHYKRKFSYWKERHVQCCYTPAIPWGNVGDVLFSRKALGELLKDMYDKCRRAGLRHTGMYFMTGPVYVPVDPEIVKCILVKDFQSFNDRGLYHDEVNDPMSAHMFALPDQKWKKLRVKLSPTFSSGKIKGMYPLMVSTSKALHTVCEDMLSKDQPFEVKDLLARFTSDVIGTCAFGIDCNSLKNPKADFIQMGKRVFEHSRWDAFKVFLSKGFSRPGIIMRFFTIDTEAVRFFQTSILDTVKQRESSETTRNDFLQLIIDLKKGREHQGNQTSEDDDSIEKPLTPNEIAAQAYLMYIAGYDTSATTATFCLYEIIKNPDVQRRMREEILRVLAKYDGEITYEACAEMKYLEKVFYETLRKYPTLPFLNRHCIKDFPVPNSKTVIANDTPILIPVMGLHRDPEFFPDPDRFDPERFSEENKAKIPSFTFLPFGEGPRNCIGSRFGMLSMKVAFCVLLRDYTFTLSAKTKEPLEIVPIPQNHLISVNGGLWANIHRIGEEDR